jgi:hypothetical protein
VGRWPSDLLVALLGGVSLLIACQQRTQIYVRDVVPPDYPRIGLVARVEGTVTVSLDVGSDGKVLAAHGAGAPPLLIKAAEQNVRNWTFGFAGRPRTFPYRWTVLYDYKLVDSDVQPACPTIVMHLPDRVEITSMAPRLEPESGNQEPHS